MNDNRYCDNCGTALNPGAEFCSACGTPTVGSGGGGGGGSAGGMNNKNLLYIGGGVVGALALAGGAYYFLSGGGAGGADTNGDGVISPKEFVTELAQLKKPKPGKWKIEWRNGVPDSGSDENFVTFSVEFEACDRRAWDEVDEFFRSLDDPKTIEQAEKGMEEGLKMFEKEADGKFKIDRFDIDGDNFELAMSASGDFDEDGNKVKGSGDFAVSGIFSEERVELEGPVNLALQMAIKESFGNPTVNFDMSTKAGYTLKAERVGDCPAGSMSRSEPDYYGYEEAAPAEEGMAADAYSEYAEEAAGAAGAMADEF